MRENKRKRYSRRPRLSDTLYSAKGSARLHIVWTADLLHESPSLSLFI